jgi:phosphonate transport system substrate-binding protein
MKYSKKFLIVLSLVVISAMLFAACAPASEPEPAPVEEVVVEEVVVEEVDPWADLGTEENPIIFVAVPSGEQDRVLAGFEKVADLVYADTGLVIEPFVAASYTAAIEAMCAKVPQAQMGSLATFAYILAAEKGCAETALVSTRYDAAFYNGQFLVRADSGLETLEDLAGTDMCRPYPLSTSGDIIPGIMLKAVGVDMADMNQIIDTGSHEATATAVLNGDCDWGATYIDARSRVEEEYADTIMDETVVIAVEPDIPNDGIQFVTGFPEELKAKLVASFIGLFDSEEGTAAMDEAYQWGGLVEKDDTFYDQFRQVLDAGGVSAADIAALAEE